ncbi:hypothetical protein AABC73_07070 [Pseudomonas sp. G.S.17]|uniref:hypothetical protein n=1 Tax=Pseudomonas sp. G.S.17 TaxID=3137451 RepID=UPI00311CB458
MILYQWNEKGYFSGQVEILDEAGPLPPNSTPIKPMKLTGKQVAQWSGDGWLKLSEVHAVIPDAQEVSKLYETAVQAKMDAAAIAARYDSIATAVSYAEEPAVPKFQNDGIAFRSWRSKVWAYAYEQLALVLAGGREQPTVEAFLLELPVLELPA